MNKYLYKSILGSVVIVLLACNSKDENPTSSTPSISQEEIYSNYIDSITKIEMQNENDSTNSAYFFKRADNLLHQVSEAESEKQRDTTINEVFAFYQNGVDKETQIPFNTTQVFYCGLLAERLGKTDLASEYFNLTISLSNENLQTAESITQAELKPLQEVELYDSLYKTNLKRFRNTQHFCIGVSQLMLGNDSLSKEKFDILKSNGVLKLFTAGGLMGIESKEEVLEWVDFD